MRIVYMGNHNIGARCLEYLLENGEDVATVFALPDERNEEVWYASVKETAQRYRVPVYQPAKVSSPEYVDIIKKLNPQVIFSFSWRQMLSTEILAIPEYGCINMHGAFLPKYRGFTPVTWVIIQGESKTGITLHYMVQKADAGDIIAQAEVAIDFKDTGQTLYDKITEAGVRLFQETYPKIKNRTAPRIRQNEKEATYFGRRTPEDGIIDWNKSAQQLYNWVRALTHPYPGAFTYLYGKQLHIWKTEMAEQAGVHGKPGEIIRQGDRGLFVATGSGSLLVTSLQPAGSKEYRGSEVSDFVREQGLDSGTVLG